MPSDDALSPTSSDSDSMDSISDFEVVYNQGWEQHYHNLLNDILTNRVLHPGPPVSKSSQLHLLDHWRIHSPEHFRRKLQIEPETFDALTALSYLYIYNSLLLFSMQDIMEMLHLQRILHNGQAFLLVELRSVQIRFLLLFFCSMMMLSIFPTLTKKRMQKVISKKRHVLSGIMGFCWLMG